MERNKHRAKHMKRMLLVAALALGLGVSPGTIPIQAGFAGSVLGRAFPSSSAALAEKSSQVDALMALWAKGDTPGAAVVVIQNGQVVHKKGYGMANLETKTPIGPDTAFDLASVSKQFTSMAIMILAERGKLDYDDPLSKFFSQFPPYAQKVTVRHLLNHTSGLPDYIELFAKTGKTNKDEKEGGFEPTSKDALELLAQQKELRFAPGEKWEYSNSGYVILGQIIEKVSGEGYAQFLKENIFEPLGMSHTMVLDETRSKIKNRAISYSREGKGYKNIDYHPLNWIYGDGNVNTTVEDMVKWDQALYTEKLVKQSTLKQAFTSGKLNDGTDIGYGFGWNVGTYLGLGRVSHSGGWVGFRTRIARFPDQRFTVIVLCNFAGFNAAAIANKISKIYLADQVTLPVVAKVDPRRLRNYVGQYAMGPDSLLEVALEDGALWVAFEDEDRMRLVPESALKFFFEDMEDMKITFNTDEKNQVTSLTLYEHVPETAVRRRP